MEYVSITCPYCGAPVSATRNSKVVKCEYCDLDIILDISSPDNRCIVTKQIKPELNKPIMRNPDMIKWNKLRRDGIIIETISLCAMMITNQFVSGNLFMIFFLISCYVGTKCPYDLWKTNPAGYDNPYSKSLSFIKYFITCNVISFLFMFIFVLVLIAFGLID